MGGPQPLGYDVIDRKLIINESEADIIRFIFEYYNNNLEGEPLWKLLDILRNKGWKNKSYTSQKGNQNIGKEFNLNKIHNILNNPIYNGKMKHKDIIYEGEHEAIIVDEIWNQVQNKISKKYVSKEFVRNPRKKSEQPKLAGKIFDYLGNRLTPTYSYKYTAAGRYKMKYYINREICKKSKTESEFKRIRAEYIDDVVTDEISKIILTLTEAIPKLDGHELSSSVSRQLQEFKSLPTEFLEKIILFPQHMELILNGADT